MNKDIISAYLSIRLEKFFIGKDLEILMVNVNE